MRAAVSTEARFFRTPDGRVWTLQGPGKSFWDRYLSAFDAVLVVARVLDVTRASAGMRRVDGAGVEIRPVPHFVGPGGFIRRRRQIRQAVHAVAGEADAVILRVPSPIGNLLGQACEKHRMPYALEVVGDPYDVFARRVVTHPLRPAMRAWSVGQLRRQTRRAFAVAYVTERALQMRYPAGPAAVVTHYSSVELPPGAFVAESRRLRRMGPYPKLVCVGSVEQAYKGVDTLLEAMAGLSAAGAAVRLVHVGDGRNSHALRRRAAELGIVDMVRFAGAVPAGAPVRRLLDDADLFVLPSRAEGLPRALIEAMARALPAIGSTVGGIPELLPATALVPPDDPDALASAIDALLSDPQALACESARNLTRSLDFAADRLTVRRDAFYRAVRFGNPDHAHVA